MLNYQGRRCAKHPELSLADPTTGKRALALVERREEDERLEDPVLP
jgi:hypothetical protein